MSLSPQAVKAILAHRDEFHPEFHHTTRRDTLLDRIQNALTIGLGLAAMFGVYAGVQLYEDNIEQRAQLQAFKSRGCPDRWKGQPFAFSAEENVSLTRPGTTRLACYFKKGVGA